MSVENCNCTLRMNFELSEREAQKLKLELASIRGDRNRLDDANIDLNHELARTKKERDFFESAFKERHGQRETLEEKLKVACGYILDSYFKGEERYEWAKQTIKSITKEK